MEPFTIIRSNLAPIAVNDIDTDQIIPADYLKVTTKEGLAEGLFARWCFTGDGDLVSDFALNRPECAKAQILLAGDNFGTGSSREHAAWALTARGFKAIISTSFADIFSNNALKNSLLPIVVDSATLQQLFTLVDEDPYAEVIVDLAEQTLTLPDGRAVTFPIDSFSKLCMIEGVDQLGYLLKREAAISAYEGSIETNQGHGVPL
jgi:3-isopropylmalate/(R)-2-methylmalate dehydratase small subunit